MHQNFLSPALFLFDWVHSLTLASPLHRIVHSLRDFRFHDSSIDAFCAYFGIQQRSSNVFRVCSSVKQPSVFFNSPVRPSRFWTVSPLSCETYLDVILDGLRRMNAIRFTEFLLSYSFPSSRGLRCFSASIGKPILNHRILAQHCSRNM